MALYARDPMFSRFAQLVNDMNAHMNEIMSASFMDEHDDVHEPEDIRSSIVSSGRSGVARLSSWPSVVAPVDLTEKGNKYVVKMDVPGLTSSDLRVSIEGGRALIVSGERKHERAEGDCAGTESENNTKNDKKREVCVRERYYGKFSRSVRLPADIDVSEVDASVHNGILTVVIGKSAVKTKNSHLINVR